MAKRNKRQPLIITECVCSLDLLSSQGISASRSIHRRTFRIKRHDLFRIHGIDGATRFEDLVDDFGLNGVFGAVTEDARFFILS